MVEVVGFSELLDNWIVGQSDSLAVGLLELSELSDC